MAAVERTLTINIRKEILKVPRYKRAKKAVTAVRGYLQQHMKAEAENVKIGKYLNLKIWEHGIKNPLTRLTVLAKKDDKGMVTAELPNIPVKKQKQVKEAHATPKAEEKTPEGSDSKTAAAVTTTKKA
ncbi:MAG: 50S ribosomal protein L31e [Nanoarchaeota archaeon]